MHRERVGDHETRAKMAELRLVCDKEIEIQQQRMETTARSFRKSLQSIESSAHETVLNEGKIGKLKAQLRAVEDDLVKALSVKTRKEATKMATTDSISATKARIEELKKIVTDQRIRKDEYAEIISHQSEVLKEFEEKHKQDAQYREEIEEAISWYNRVLGFRYERGRVLDCHPHVSEAKKLMRELNITNGLFNFVRTMRAKFEEEAGSCFHPQEPCTISVSAPTSTDSGSGTPRQAKRVGKPGSASSVRRSPRFKVKK